jgi:hypothetical protein
MWMDGDEVAMTSFLTERKPGQSCPVPRTELGLVVRPRTCVTVQVCETRVHEQVIGLARAKFDYLAYGGRWHWGDAGNGNETTELMRSEE